MNKLILLLALFPMIVVAQRGQKEEKITYFTDSEVKRSSFSLATDGSLFYNNRSRIGEGFTPGQSGSTDDLPSTNGTLGWNSAFHLVWRITGSLEVWGGVAYAIGGWTDKHTEYMDQNSITKASLDFINFPIQFNFRSQLNDLWDLEILPMIEINMLNSYTEDVYLRSNPDIRLISSELTQDARLFNYTIGLSISARYRFYENWSMHFRPFFHYMLNSLIDDPDRPRDVLYGTGLSVGFRYQFN